VAEGHFDGRKVGPGRLSRYHDPGCHDELGRVSGKLAGITRKRVRQAHRVAVDAQPNHGRVVQDPLVAHQALEAFTKRRTAACGIV
jgi:hypothetical protein